MEPQKPFTHICVARSYHDHSIVFIFDNIPSDADLTEAWKQPTHQGDWSIRWVNVRKAHPEEQP